MILSSVSYFKCHKVLLLSLKMEITINSSIKLMKKDDKIYGRYFRIEYETLVDKKEFYNWFYINYIQNQLFHYYIYIFHHNNKSIVFFDTGPKGVEYRPLKDKIRFTYECNLKINIPSIYKYKYKKDLFNVNIEEYKKIDKDFYATFEFIKLIKGDEDVQTQMSKCSICSMDFIRYYINEDEEIICGKCEIINNLENESTKEVIKEIEKKVKEKSMEEKIDFLIKKDAEKDRIINEQTKSISILQTQNQYIINMLNNICKENEAFKNISDEIIQNNNVNIFIIDLGKSTTYLDEHSFYIPTQRRKELIGTNYSKYNLYFFGIIDEGEDILPKVRKQLETYSINELNIQTKKSIINSSDFELNRINYIIGKNKNFIKTKFILRENVFDNNLVLFDRNFSSIVYDTIFGV